MKLLLSPDPAGGGGPSNADNTQVPATNPAPPADPTPPAPPPAATTVLTGERSESELQLQTEVQRLEDELSRLQSALATTEEAKVQREKRIAELEDSLHRLTSPPPAAEAKVQYARLGRIRPRKG